MVPRLPMVIVLRVQHERRVAARSEGDIGRAYG